MSDPRTDPRSTYTDEEVMALVSRLSSRTTSIGAAARTVMVQAEAIEKEMRALILEITRRLQGLAGSVAELQGIAREKVGEDGNGKPRPPGHKSKTRPGATRKAG